MTSWYEFNKGLLAGFVRDHATSLESVSPVFQDPNTRESYILLGLKKDVPTRVLKFIGFEFEEIFPGISYAMEDISADPFWDVPFPEPDSEEDF